MPSRQPRMPRWGLAIVSGRSMEPTLRAGDRLLVRYAVAPSPGDLVLVRLPPGPDGPRPVAVKRLTQLEAGGGLWVESDNLGVGVDSWTVGALPRDACLARVLFRLPRGWWRGGPDAGKRVRA